MKQWIFTAVCILAFVNSYAQLRKVEGFVVDEDKQPIADVVVLDMDSTDNVSITDSLGRFSINHVIQTVGIQTHIV